MTQESRRDRLLQICARLDGSPLAPGTTGNASVRSDDGTGGAFFVTAAGVGFGDASAENLARVEIASGPAADANPSSEWRLHAAVYRQRPDVGAIVHLHPPAATALSCLRRPLPAFHYMVALAGGSEIPCAPYATFGTQALAEHVADTLGRSLRACLMANHGVVAVGDTPAAALRLATEVESLAGQYLDALAAGDPIVLDPVEMDRVVKQFAIYAGGTNPLVATPTTAADPAPTGLWATETGGPSLAVGSSGESGARAAASTTTVAPKAAPDAPGEGEVSAPLVLLTHGSPDPRWKANYLHVAERLADTGSGPVRIAYLQFEEPNLRQVAAEYRDRGVRRLRVLPVFFAAGKHLREDVPDLVRAVEAAGSEIELLDAPADRTEFADALVGVLEMIRGEGRTVAPDNPIDGR